MKLVYLLALCVLYPTYTSSAQQSTQKIPLTESQWQFAPERASFITHRNVPAIKVTPDPENLFADAGQVVLSDVVFSDGTIEFDVEITDFFLTAIYFRRADAEHGEVFYLRTYRADDPTGPDAIQYTTVTGGAALWDLHPRYQAPATIHKEGWNHVKMVVSGKRMQVYVNDMDTPALTIPELVGDATRGSIALEGGGIYANLSIKHGATEDLPVDAAYDPATVDPGYIHNWEVSAPFELPAGQELVSAMATQSYSEHLPDEQAHWESIHSERDGLINLSRRHGKSDTRRALWLKKTIVADKERSPHLQLGFSDEVWVLLNGRLVYVDKNIYGSPIMKDPYGQISLSDSEFALPLQEGENELLIGVANSFFGWAIMARLENMEGLHWGTE